MDEKMYEYSFKNPEITYCSLCPCCEFKPPRREIKGYCRVEMRPLFDIHNIIPDWCRLKKKEVGKREKRL